MADRDPARRSPVSRGRPALVLDVQNGYLDRLLMTPIRRLAILARAHGPPDVTVAIALTVPILAVGFALGVRFETGVLGLIAFRHARRTVELGFSRASATPLRSRRGTRPAGELSVSCCSSRSCSSRRRTCRARSCRAGSTGSAALNPVTYLLDGLRLPS